MNWLLDNWYMIIVIGALFGVIFYQYRHFNGLPNVEQENKIRQWLLYAVMMAEKEFQHGTGELKLRYVYSMFIDKYPRFASCVPFELFSRWVDQVLVQMKHLLETNKDIESYVKGE